MQRKMAWCTISTYAPTAVRFWEQLAKYPPQAGFQQRMSDDSIPFKAVALRVPR